MNDITAKFFGKRLVIGSVKQGPLIFTIFGQEVLAASSMTSFARDKLLTGISSNRGNSVRFQFYDSGKFISVQGDTTLQIKSKSFLFNSHDSQFQIFESIVPGQHFSSCCHIKSLKTGKFLSADTDNNLAPEGSKTPHYRVRTTAEELGVNEVFLVMILDEKRLQDILGISHVK